MAEANGNIVTSIDAAAVRRVHLLGVAGTGMGAFAGMLKEVGYEVTGSDENVYPPMSDMLAQWGVDVMTPYRAENLDAARPDLVVVGNVIRRINPEATAARERGLPQTSFPAALGQLVLAGRHSVVVAGTHGKTTTSALLAHVLVATGRDPWFLVGGVTLNQGGNFRIGQGEHVVLEGDEYDTAYFDKGPKFLHYQARSAMVTSIEFDHADIYRDLAHYESSFEKFAASLPRDGFLAVAASYPRAVELMRQHSSAPVATYGVDIAADYSARALRFDAGGAHFTITEPGGESGALLLPMSGRHNVENAVGVYAVARALGLDAEEVRQGFASFAGVKRRQEVRGEPNGVMVLDDFAHHPTAVRETVEAIRARYPDRPLWAVFEPRSNTSRRNIHQQEYATAFGSASHVVLKAPEHHDQVPRDQELGVHRIVEAVRGQGIDAQAHADVQAILDQVASEARPGDIVLVMSNGAFGGLIPKLLERLSK